MLPSGQMLKPWSEGHGKPRNLKIFKKSKPCDVIIFMPTTWEKLFFEFSGLFKMTDQ